MSRTLLKVATAVIDGPLRSTIQPEMAASFSSTTFAASATSPQRLRLVRSAHFFMILRAHEVAWPVTPESQPGPVARCVIFAPRKYTAAHQATTSA